jgi:hypothetical protein
MRIVQACRSTATWWALAGAVSVVAVGGALLVGPASPANAQSAAAVVTAVNDGPDVKRTFPLTRTLRNAAGEPNGCVASAVPTFSLPGSTTGVKTMASAFVDCPPDNTGRLTVSWARYEVVGDSLVLVSPKMELGRSTGSASSGIGLGGCPQGVSGTHEYVNRYWLKSKTDAQDPNPYEAVVEGRSIITCPSDARSLSFQKLNERLLNAAGETNNCVADGRVPYTVTDRNGVVQASWGVSLTCDASWAFSRVRTLVSERTAGGSLVVVSDTSTATGAVQPNQPLYEDFAVPCADLPGTREYIVQHWVTTKTGSADPNPYKATTRLRGLVICPAG